MSAAFPRVLVFAGSNRADSINRKLASTAAMEIRQRGLEVKFLDLRDFPMPLYDGDDDAAGETPRAVLEFRSEVAAHDALVIASPEYNGSFSALIKNTLDWISRPVAGEGPLAVFRGKKAAILSASPGRGGGQRGLRHLRELLEMLGITVISTQVSVGLANAAFAADGALVRDSDRLCLSQLASELHSSLQTPAQL